MKFFSLLVVLVAWIVAFPFGTFYLTGYPVSLGLFTPGQLVRLMLDTLIYIWVIHEIIQFGKFRRII